MWLQLPHVYKGVTICTPHKLTQGELLPWAVDLVPGHGPKSYTRKRISSLIVFTEGLFQQRTNSSCSFKLGGMHTQQITLTRIIKKTPQGFLGTNFFQTRTFYPQPHLFHFLFSPEVV